MSELAKTPAGLVAESLSFAYDAHLVLRDIHLAIQPGEVVALVGPNGSGKTTLLRRLAGFLEGAGKILYGESSMSSMTSRERAQKRAYVPQRLPSSFPYSVADMVAMGVAHRERLYSSNVSEASIQGALDRVEFKASPKRPYAHLSGGERQQVLIARALLQQGPIYLLDEPTSALDLQHRAAVIRALRQEAARGATILMSLHDLNLAATAADRLLLLADGEIVAQGEPSVVLMQECLQKVYQADVLVNPHPKTGAPTVVLDPAAWS